MKNEHADRASATTGTPPWTATSLADWATATAALANQTFPLPGREQIAYRPEAAARAIGISRSALYQELASGRLRSVKIGRSRLITREAIAEFLTQLAAEDK